MRKVAVLLSVGLALILFGKALAVDPMELTATVESANFTPPPARINPIPAVPQYNYDAALTNIGIHAPQNDCIWEWDDMTIWVMVQNAGYEIVDCAEVVFTLNGEEFARVHVTGLYPDEVRKYSATTVAPPPCGVDDIAAHIDWPLDENPENNDIDDIFSTASEADTTLQHDSGVLSSAWTWIEGYEYPDYALGSKWRFELGGVIKYIEMAYTNVSGRRGGHSEFFVMEADSNGNIIDDGTGGIMNMEFQHQEIYWTNYAFMCYPICLPVEPGDVYYFVWCNRQEGINYWVIDDGENNPDWNWQKQAGQWSSGSLYAGDWFFRVSLCLGAVDMTCDNLTPIFCRGTYFNFRVTVNNYTQGHVAGPVSFTGYSGHDCDPRHSLVSIARTKSYPPGSTTQAYRFKVPKCIWPGSYSASVAGVLDPGGHEVSCCMNTTIVQCEPWRIAGNEAWELVEIGHQEVNLPTATMLHQNSPNPFNANTTISYRLAVPCHVRLEVYNLRGEKLVTLVDDQQEAGYSSVSWDASAVSTGLYFYKLIAGGYCETRRMVLVK